MHGAHVNFHIILAPKAFAAMVACVRTFFEVDSGGVTIQTALLTELEAAFSAGERACLVVCARDVAVMGGDTGEGFAAETAFNAMGWTGIGGFEMGRWEGRMGE